MPQPAPNVLNSEMPQTAPNVLNREQLSSQTHQPGHDG